MHLGRSLPFRLSTRATYLRGISFPLVRLRTRSAVREPLFTEGMPCGRLVRVRKSRIK